MRIAGNDGPGRPALPIGELLAPIPLAAVVVLVVNDRFLKAAAPGWITGKLSDFAGMLFFPLFLTAAWDLLLFTVARRRADFSLNRTKLLLAIAATGLAFGAIKLSPEVAHVVELALRALGFRARITPDPSDASALIMLAGAYWLGVREIQRVPLGRIEVMALRGRVLLPDVREAGPLAADLELWLARRDEPSRAAAQAALDAHRGK
jgi:hypothetical protein